MWSVYLLGAQISPDAVCPQKSRTLVFLEFILWVLHPVLSHASLL